MSILDLPARVQALAAADRELFDRLFRVSVSEGRLRAPGESPPEDRCGRIEGAHCLTAANVAKAEAWHGLIVFLEPEPMAFTHESVLDCLETARRWWAAAPEGDTEAGYPLLFWNCGP